MNLGLFVVLEAPTNFSLFVSANFCLFSPPPPNWFYKDKREKKNIIVLVK